MNFLNGRSRSLYRSLCLPDDFAVARFGFSSVIVSIGLACRAILFLPSGWGTSVLAWSGPSSPRHAGVWALYFMLGSCWVIDGLDTGGAVVRWTVTFDPARFHGRAPVPVSVFWIAFQLIYFTHWVNRSRSSGLPVDRSCVSGGLVPLTSATFGAVVLSNFWWHRQTLGCVCWVSADWSFSPVSLMALRLLVGL